MSVAFFSVVMRGCVGGLLLKEKSEGEEEEEVVVVVVVVVGRGKEGRVWERA